MTGMPAFARSKTDDEVWALVAFLNVLPRLTAPDFAGTIGTAGTMPATLSAKSGG